MMMVKKFTIMMGSSMRIIVTVMERPQHNATMHDTRALSNLKTWHRLQTGGPALLADRGLRLREGRIGPDLVSSRLSSSLIFLNSEMFAKVRDKVEESLVKEGDNVRLWQLRIKTAMEQVDTRVIFHPKNRSSHFLSTIHYAWCWRSTFNKRRTSQHGELFQGDYETYRYLFLLEPLPCKDLSIWQPEREPVKNVLADFVR